MSSPQDNKAALRTHELLSSGAELSWHFFCHFLFGSRLPSLVFAVKISNLLHFVAKISHSHCSSFFHWFHDFFHGVYRVVHGFHWFFHDFHRFFHDFHRFPMVFNFSIVFFKFSMVFFNCSMAFFDCSMALFHFSMGFFIFSMFFLNFCMVFIHFSLVFIDCSRVFIDFYMVFIDFSLILSYQFLKTTWCILMYEICQEKHFKQKVTGTLCPFPGTPLASACIGRPLEWTLLCLVRWQTLYAYGSPYMCMFASFYKTNQTQTRMVSWCFMVMVSATKAASDEDTLWISLKCLILPYNVTIWVWVVTSSHPHGDIQ